MFVAIWLDDQVPEPDGYFRVTTAEHCIAMLKVHRGNVHTLSLDHDLGLDGNGVERMTGYEVAKFLEEAAYRGDWDMIPSRIECHSSNGPGSDRIKAAVRNIQKWLEEEKERTKRERTKRELLSRPYPPGTKYGLVKRSNLFWIKVLLNADVR